MKNKFIRTLIACLIISAVSLGGFFGYKYFFPSKAAAATSQYITQTAKKMNLQVNIQGTGTVYAGVSKDITGNNSGTLQGLNLKVGETVTAGANLFTVDSNDLRQSVTKAKNNLQRQQLTASNAKNDNEVAIDNLSIKDAQNQLNSAQDAVNKMTVTAPISGMITAENNSNGDNIQSGKTLLTVVDPSSMKIKVSVDELNISKVKVGEKTQIKFDALKDKTYEGTVEQVAESGTTTNNVTNYEVIVSITNPTDIKIGMNANVNILVDSKDNALAIPVEALIDKDGKKFIMIPNSDGTANNSTSSSDSNNNQKSSSGSGQASKGNSQGQRANGQGGQNSGNSSRNGSNGFSSDGKLVPVTTGLENDNYVEILDGINEGQQVLISLPKTSSSTSSNGKSGFSGIGSMGGNFGGGASGGNRQQGGSKGN